MLESEISWRVDRVTDQKTGAVLSEQLSERIFTPLNRLAPRVIAVEFEEIEGVELG